MLICINWLQSQSLLIAIVSLYSRGSNLVSFALKISNHKLNHYALGGLHGSPGIISLELWKVPSPVLLELELGGTASTENHWCNRFVRNVDEAGLDQARLQRDISKVLKSPRIGCDDHSRQ
mmetsp:Transcript_857/g.1871  ORF Transcript_857/g.1871 Transcript_857/m.1871 type:complete len:121 (-) Transcript_857:1040-1402(-)